MISGDYDWHIVDLANGSQKVDGVEYGNATLSVTPFSIYLFDSNQDWGHWYCKGVRLDAAKIYSGDTLLRDYCAAMRLSDNKPGMYDFVNGVFYTNAGNGEFLFN